MQLATWFHAAPVLVCYDGEPPVEGDDGTTPPEPPKTFTQEALDKIVQERLAKERRAQESKYKELEVQYTKLLENQSLSQEERTKLEESLTNIQAQLRTRDQQAAHEKKQLEESYAQRLQSLEAEGQKWKLQYVDSTINRALQDAAIGQDAFNAAQIVGLLRPMTKMVEQTDEKGKGTGIYVPMVDFADKDPDTGAPIMTQRTPENAVTRMKELPDIYGNLFKSGVVSGIGAGTATGGASSGTGRVDVRKLTPAQYQEIRKKNPAALGL